MTTRHELWRCACLASALALGTGCGAMVLWNGRSPDRLHRAVIVDAGGRQRLLLDGAVEGEWNAIGVPMLR